MPCNCAKFVSTRPHLTRNLRIPRRLLRLRRPHVEGSAPASEDILTAKAPRAPRLGGLAVPLSIGFSQ